MRLINTSSLELEEFLSNEVPRYAILSHTWGRDEVTLQEYKDVKSRDKLGYQKIRQTCAQAQKNGIPYAWVDTCCIDKTSSAELSEAINSMWNWYRAAVTCYAYLSDVSIPQISALNERKASTGARKGSESSTWTSLPASRWTTRGWTLQELLAPREVEFFSGEWILFGTRSSLAVELSRHAGIDIEILQGREKISSASVAKRMSWAAKRQTTRIEDAAYCLLGIFEVNMPLLYGEGEKAFIRLQEEILRVSDDESVFAWFDAQADPETPHGLLAKSPLMFAAGASLVHYRDWSKSQSPVVLSNLGVSVELPLTGRGIEVQAWLRCKTAEGGRIGICLEEVSQATNQFVRIKANTLLSGDQSSAAPAKRVYVRQRLIEPTVHDIVDPVWWFCNTMLFSHSHGRPDYRQITCLGPNGRIEPYSRLHLSHVPSQLSTVYVVAPAAGLDAIFILVGSSKLLTAQRKARKPSFMVRYASHFGYPSSAVTTELKVFFSKPVSGFDRVRTAYNPEHNLGEAVIFDNQHRIGVHGLDSSGPSSALCIIVDSWKPPIAQGNAADGEQLKATDKRPSESTALSMKDPSDKPTKTSREHFFK